MMYLRSCPRCGGDLQEEGDKYGTYVACIQCGNHLTGREEAIVASHKGTAKRTRRGSQRWRVGLVASAPRPVPVLTRP